MTYNNFTGIAQCSKTIRNEIIPVGWTKQLIKNNEILESDEKRDEKSEELKKLMDDYYKVGAVQPVDMFPHTPHVENVVLLEKRSDADTKQKLKERKEREQAIAEAKAAKEAEALAKAEAQAEDLTEEEQKACQA